MEDGQSLRDGKAFSYNLAEKIKLYTESEKLNFTRRRHNSVSFVS